MHPFYYASLFCRIPCYVFRFSEYNFLDYWAAIHKVAGGDMYTQFRDCPQGPLDFIQCYLPSFGRSLSGRILIVSTLGFVHT